MVDYVKPDKISGILIYRRKFLTPLRPFVSGCSPRGLGRFEYKKSLLAKSLSAPGAAARLLEAQSEYAMLTQEAEARQREAHKRKSGALDVLDAPSSPTSRRRTGSMR